MTLGLETGPLGTDGPGEFRCQRCRARCTRSPTKDLEYGHKRGCPNRPENLQRWVAGDPYDPEKDPRASHQQLVTDGGSAASPELTESSPQIVECPGCGRRGSATAEILICSGCGAEFRPHGGDAGGD